METAPTDAEVIPEWSFADRLRKIRREVLALDQAGMARLLGVPQTSYSNWETGRSVPRDLVAVASRVQLASRVPAAWVLGLESAAAEAAIAAAERSASGSGPDYSAASSAKRRQTEFLHYRWSAAHLTARSAVVQLREPRCAEGWNVA